MNKKKLDYVFAVKHSQRIFIGAYISWFFAIYVIAYSLRFGLTRDDWGVFLLLASLGAIHVGILAQTKLKIVGDEIKFSLAFEKTVTIYAENAILKIEKYSIIEKNKKFLKMQVRDRSNRKLKYEFPIAGFKPESVIEFLEIARAKGAEIK